MRNIFLLIRRFHVLLLFLVFQILSISLLVKYSNSHEARYMQYAYEITGRINKSYFSLTHYFSLAENNKLLAEENARLRNQLDENFVKVDTSASLQNISTVQDSVLTTRKYLWRMAKVINNSVSSQNNYITLERGSKQGISKNMAVVGANGIVGIVTDVSANMSVAMSLLHRKSNTSVALKNSGVAGILEWDGKNPQILQLKGIPKSARLTVGDTILTSNLSLNYPGGLMVGTIAAFEADEGGNDYFIDVKPGTNFYTIDYVSIIENLFINEQQTLESRIKKTNN